MMDEINLDDKGAIIKNGVRDFLGRTWWATLIGGIAALIFGILLLFNPAAGIVVLAMFFTAFLFVDGLTNIVAAMTHRQRQGWWLMLIYGVLALLVSIWLIINPPAGILAFVYAVAFFSLVAGITQILLGYHIRKEVEGEWMLYLNGALSILLGLLILFRIGIGSLIVVYLIAFWAIFIGLLRIFLALKAKKFFKKIRDLPALH